MNKDPMKIETARELALDELELIGGGKADFSNVDSGWSSSNGESGFSNSNGTGCNFYNTGTVCWYPSGNGTMFVYL